MSVLATAGRYVREIVDHSHEMNTSNLEHAEEPAMDVDRMVTEAQSLPVIAPAETKRGECVSLRADLLCLPIAYLDRPLETARLYSV